MYRHDGQASWTWSVRGRWRRKAQVASTCDDAQHLISRPAVLLLLCLAVGVQAQERPGAEPPAQHGLPSLPGLEEQPSKPPGGPILPPLPPAAPAERPRLPQQVRVLVR